MLKKYISSNYITIFNQNIRRILYIFPKFFFKFIQYLFFVHVNTKLRAISPTNKGYSYCKKQLFFRICTHGFATNNKYLYMEPLFLISLPEIWLTSAPIDPPREHCPYHFYQNTSPKIFDIRSRFLKLRKIFLFHIFPKIVQTKFLT